MTNNRIINPFEPLIEGEYQKAKEPELENFLEQITKENQEPPVNRRGGMIT